MKRILAILLASIMLFSLCACGNNTPADSTGSTAGESTGATTQKDETPKFLNDDGTIRIPEFAGQNTKLKSATSLDNEYMKAEIISLNCSDKSVEFTVKVDNKTNEKFSFYFGFEYHALYFGFYCYSIGSCYF